MGGGTWPLVAPMKLSSESERGPGGGITIMHMMVGCHTACMQALQYQKAH